MIVHPLHPHEMAFVCSSWKSSLMDGLKAMAKVNDRRAWALLNHVIDHVAVPRCLVLVAVTPAADDEPELAHGWIALSGKRIVYAYVKPRYRGMGVFRQLRAEAPEATWAGFDPFLELERMTA